MSGDEPSRREASPDRPTSDESDTAERSKSGTDTEQADAAETIEQANTDEATEQANTNPDTEHGDTDAATEKPGPGEVYCRHCGEIISEQAEICPECGVRQKPAPGFGNQAGIAALASLVIPGAGQIYLGHLNRGILFVVASAIAGFLSIFIVGIPFLLAIWLYAIYDAYKLGQEGASDRPGPT